MRICKQDACSYALRNMSQQHIFRLAVPCVSSMVDDFLVFLVRFIEENIIGMHAR